MTHLRAALNALAYTTGFALGRCVEAHYRRNLARVVPQPEPQPLDPRATTERVAMRAELRIQLGLADLDFNDWQAERERDVAAGESA